MLMKIENKLIIRYVMSYDDDDVVQYVYCIV